MDNKIEAIEKEGFHLISHFTLPRTAWLDHYYLPMEDEISRLMEKYKGNETALGVFESMESEITMYKKYGEHYGYEFFIMSL